MQVTIYHNPNCGTSRNTLAMIRNAGIEPTVVEYLKQPPSREELKDMIARAGLSVREALREKGTPYAELGLDNPALSDDEFLDAMMAHPILINRPFVVTPIGTKLCRPSEAVLDILPSAQQGPFSKEDGVAVIGADGKEYKADQGRGEAPSTDSRARLPLSFSNQLFLRRSVSFCLLQCHPSLALCSIKIFHRRCK